MSVPRGCLALGLFLVFLALLPFVLANAVLTALARLGLGPNASVLIAAAIFLGGAVNIPIRRIPRREAVAVAAFRLFGMPRIVPRLVRRRTYTVIAVNLGGCVIPSAIALYQLFRLAWIGGGAFLAGIGAVAVNTAVCHRVARPVPNVGITMPALVPALVAAATALLLAPDLAPTVVSDRGHCVAPCSRGFSHMSRGVLPNGRG